MTPLHLYRLGNRRQPDDVICRLRFASQDTFKVCRPGLERVALLGIVAVSVVDRGHVRLDVVQNLAYDEAVDPERGAITLS